MSAILDVTAPQTTAGLRLEQQTIRKVSIRLIPFLFLLYVACYLDRANVSLAALQMNQQLRFSAAAYGFGAGIFFIGYSLFGVPSNLMLARLGAHRWIACIAIAWGVVASAMVFIRTPIEFYLVRFVLGMAEAGFFPGIVFYLGEWFPARWRGRAMSRFMVAIPLSIAVGGPLGGALLSLDGRLGLPGWRWLFLLEGMPSMALGIVALLYLTDRPEDATWLSPDQRRWLRGVLSAEGLRDTNTDPGGEQTIREAFASGTLWWLSLPYTLALIGGYGLALWVPRLIKEALRVSDQNVGLVTGLVGLAGVAGMLLNAADSDRTGERVLHSAVPLIIMAAGFALGAWLRHPVIAVCGFAVAYFGYNAFLPAVWCVPSLFLRGTAAATGIGLLNSIGNLGGFIGPYALGAVKTASGSFTGGLLAVAAGTMLAAALLLPIRGVCAARAGNG